MGKNDLILLKELVSKQKKKIAPDMTEQEFFEYFVPEIILKNKSLEYEEIESGITGGGKDGGIDAIYCFIDGNFVTTDFDTQKVRENPNFEVFIFQVSTSSSYELRKINSWIESVDDLFDLNKSLESLQKEYSSKLVNVISDFRSAFQSLTEKFPTISFSFYYATQGDSKGVDQTVKQKAKKLESKTLSFFSDCESAVKFIGANELIDLSRKAVQSNLELIFQESLTSSDQGIVCLVKLSDYFDFITDEKGEKRQSIFDANVREYEGSVEINKAIAETLVDKNTENFWWLNNGITILAAKVATNSKKLTIKNPKVVNGLQTSREIFNYLKNSTDKEPDSRLILIKVIVTEDEAIKNSVIKATNNQTRILAYSLRTTNKIHYDIEDYLKNRDIYYDRQKNYYKNQEFPKNKIITVQYLAQSITAILLQEPNNARGRPTNLIKDDASYNKIFNENNDLEIYFKCVSFLRRIDEFLQKEAVSKIKAERTNLRFQLAFLSSVLNTKSLKMTPNTITEKLNCNPETKFLKHSSSILWKIFNKLKKQTKYSSDRIAKSKEFDTAIFKYLSEELKAK